MTLLLEEGQQYICMYKQAYTTTNKEGSICLSLLPMCGDMEGDNNMYI